MSNTNDSHTDSSASCAPLGANAPPTVTVISGCQAAQDPQGPAVECSDTACMSLPMSTSSLESAAPVHSLGASDVSTSDVFARDMGSLSASKVGSLYFPCSIKGIVP